MKNNSAAINPEKVIEEIESKSWHWYNQLFWFFRYRIWQIPSDVKLYVVSFFQRGRRGWARSDTWEFFAYLSTVIKEGLLHLKKHQHGHPADMTEKEWNEILDTMIEAFSMAEEIGNGEKERYLPYFSEEDRKKFNCLTKEEDRLMKRGMHLFVVHYFSLWD